MVAGDKIADIVKRAVSPEDANMAPGVPGPQEPATAEPQDPREPLPPKADQDTPDTASPTGAETGAAKITNAQQGAFLTTATGTRVRDTDHSLKAGRRGPTLLQDHHLREKITHFDHERIPERVVHARGAAAHGVFKAYGNAEGVTAAGFLAKDVETPVFVRFSTVLGSRGSADTARDTRGFAVKFYTDEGNFDLVGNNIPVFFIQDGIKFPDVIHAAKPHPDREIPQAQSAHDTFWDFVSLHTEATHHTMWNMSDRGIARSYRTMEGFGVHTFRLVNAASETALAKWHWKPMAGVHSLVWEEALMLNGMDPDFHRRDLFDAIESGAFPQWEPGIQTFPDTPEQTFEGIDLLDATKLVPEELAPVQRIGLMTLNANTTNYFAETEQVAFHLGNMPPGIDHTDDPLLHARLFSYVDTQLTRLGGPNYNQLPINRPHAPVNDMLRDGMHQTAIHGGVAPYIPNSLDGGCPFHAGADMKAMADLAVTVPEAKKVRDAPASFQDHFSQPRMFWRSMTEVEQNHIVDAYTFELSKCFETVIRERALGVLANIDGELCERVAYGLGLTPPAAATVSTDELSPSPALSQIGGKWPTPGRIVGIVVSDDTDLETVLAAKTAVADRQMVPMVVAARGGTISLPEEGAEPLAVQRALHATRSVEFDSLLLAGVPQRNGATDERVTLMLSEAFRHGKVIGSWVDTTEAFAKAGVDTAVPGIVTGTDADQVVSESLEQLQFHRHWVGR